MQAVEDASSTATTPLADTELPLPLGVKIAYAAPSLASAGLTIPIFALMPKFYSDHLGAPLGLIALAIAIARAFDAITDPAMGWLSDHTRTRWGRRRPWLALGAPFTAASMIAMFAPPETLTPVGASLWFGLTFGAYFLFHTVYFVPYGALGFELTLDYNERSSLFGWNQAFALMGSCVAGATPFVVSAGFKDTPRTGYVLVGVFFSVLLVGLFGWLVARIRERPEFASRASNPIVPGVRRTLRNSPFRVLLLVYVVSSLTGAIPVTVAPFYIPYVLKAENEGLVLSLTIVGYVISGAMSIPLWVYLARKLGKRSAWFVSIWIGIVGGLSFFFMGEGDTGIFVTMVFFTGTSLGAGLLHPAMKADIIDYDELHTGKRREAQYASFWAIVPKFIAIPSAALPLAVLGAVGYVPNQEQPEIVSFTLRALLGLTPAVTGIAAFLIALRFPMTEARHRAVLVGIAQHGRGEPAEDPLTGELVPPPTSDEGEEETRWYLDHFSPRELRRVLRRGPAHVALGVATWAAGCLALSLGLVGWVYGEVGDVSEKPGVSVTLAVVAAGFALAGFLFHALRVRPALRMRRDPTDTETLKRHLEH